jgi:hypothetical protein
MPDLARPIAVGGASSSGTTLLAVVLSRHARLACGPELSVLDKPQLFDADWTRLGPRLVRKPRQRMEIVDLRWRRPLFDALDGYRVDEPELGALAARAGSAREWLDAFAALHLERDGKQRWAEKTPSKVRADRALRGPGARARRDGGARARVRRRGLRRAPATGRRGRGARGAR